MTTQFDRFWRVPAGLTHLPSCQELRPAHDRHLPRLHQRVPPMARHERPDDRRDAIKRSHVEAFLADLRDRPARHEGTIAPATVKKHFLDDRGALRCRDSAKCGHLLVVRPLTLWVALVAVCSALVLAGCASTPRSGTIIGVGSPCIGPMNPPRDYLMTVSVLDANERVVAQNSRLANPYRFTFTVPPGDYTVTAAGDSQVKAHVQGGKVVYVVLGADCL